MHFTLNCGVTGNSLVGASASAWHGSLIRHLVVCHYMSSGSSLLPHTPVF